MVDMDTNKEEQSTKPDQKSAETPPQSQQPVINPPVVMRSSLPADSRSQSASVRRRSLNISHFNAVQNAVSTLARIDDFNLEELGYGFFSDVFKVTHKLTGKVMVLKRNRDTNTKMNILREVQLMNRLSHPNILKFIGVCVHEGKLHALTEYINGGDLDQLVTKKGVVLPWKQRMKLSKDVASGMSYLHSVGIFHRDLTAKNCLVRIATHKSGTQKMTGVVADLGLAEKIPLTPEDEGRLAIVGTPYIIAPEAINGKPYNQTADIFSYGIITCQLIALISCDPEELPRSSDFGLAKDLFLKMVHPTAQLTTDNKPENSFPPPKEYLQLAFDCCQMEPKSRPPFKEIVIRLETMLKAYKKTLEPKRSSSFRVAEGDRPRYVGRTSDTLPRRKGTAGKSTLDTPSGSSPVKYPARQSRQSKRPSSCSRLSRSFSDISRELLTHAANMVASSSCSFNDDAAESDVFANPFSALEHLEGGNRKLIDEPSLALLEMTFDLSTPRDLKSVWRNELKTPPKKTRPRSSVFGDSAHPNITPPPSLHLPSPSHSQHHLSSSSFGSRSSTPEHGRCDGCEYQRAKHRAMLLSPRGNDLASWWCMRKRAEGQSFSETERQSLASVVSVLSRNLRSSRRCISMPDVSRIKALFHQITEDPEKLPKETVLRKPRSNTSAEIFQPVSNPSSIKEETETEVEKSPIPKTDLTDTDAANTETTCTSKIQKEVLSKDNTQQPPEPPAIPVQTDNLTKPCETEDNLRKSDSFSSTSSGCSSSDLTASLQSAEITRKRRNDPLHSAYEKENRSLNNNYQPYNDNVRLRQPKSTHRDSGYEDTVLSSLVEHPGITREKCSNTWCINEDGLPAPQVPSTGRVAASCSLGARTTIDWNSNENPLHATYTWQGDAVL
nr:fatty acyl-CoA synthetase and RNA processing-associated kinase 1-like [Ciona intestinalis]|eukprot:XP_002121616.3 fatty acyl-CoA synthetase and RNA processing-associated kinase 1-like [Ciona intestinalis]